MAYEGVATASKSITSEREGVATASRVIVTEGEGVATGAKSITTESKGVATGAKELVARGSQVAIVFAPRDYPVEDALKELTDKSSHLGRAGQFATMAELLARGWNVSVPEVDVGDDVFVARDDATELTRVQVKTASPSPRDEGFVVTFKLSADQVRRAGNVPLVFVFAVPIEARWEFLVMPQRELLELRGRYLASQRPRGPGRAATPHAVTWMFELTLRPGQIEGWGESLSRWRNDWSGFRVLRINPADAREPAPNQSP